MLKKFSAAIVVLCALSASAADLKSPYEQGICEIKEGAVCAAVGAALVYRPLNMPFCEISSEIEDFDTGDNPLPIIRDASLLVVGTVSLGYGVGTMTKGVMHICYDFFRRVFD